MKKKNLIKVSKEQTFPFLFKIGGMFFALGGLIGGCISVGVVSIKSFFHLKRKVDEDIFQKKYIELKIKNKR